VFKTPLLVEACDDLSHSLGTSLVNTETMWSLLSSKFHFSVRGSSLSACAVVGPFKLPRPTAGAVAPAVLDSFCKAAATESATELRMSRP